MPSKAGVQDRFQLSRLWRPEVGVRLALIAAACAFALLLFELPALTGILDYRTLIGPSHAWFAPNIPDRELLRIHRPHAHQSASARGGDITSAYQIPASDMSLLTWNVKYDRNGFRNATDLEQADIAVIGDSFVEGLTVADSQLSTSVLARLQGKVVANLGQSAYGPQQELIVLKRYGLPLHPRIVLWMFSESSDLGDVIAYRRDTAIPETFWRSYRDRSFIRAAYKEIRRIISSGPKQPAAHRAGVLREPDGRMVNVYFTYASRPLNNESFDAIRQTGEIIKDAQRLVAAQGGRLVFVFIPDKFRVFHSFCQFPLESECRGWSVSDLEERLPREIRSVSPESGYLDLTPDLVSSVQRGGLPYYPDDAHWSEEGHRIAAEAINRYLQQMESGYNTIVAGPGRQ